ncbi:hypothetical protein FLGE108171_13075 [Flavobacterium gelidilacus]|jgi:MarR-like DNA-binding transcriptional regulator SgrR of sgrS sRNA|uniref:hypothetical protein n=1 Tax=Flavobacterium gelidilacus TaxID=206041 RepID=UPI00040ADFC1|nr:hypothetical protein [Flavobacterium gelidilacus]
MQTTYYLSSAQEINADILEAIKIAFKSKAITITIEEQHSSEVNEDTKEMLDYRLNDYLKNPTEVENFEDLLDKMYHEI